MEEERQIGARIQKVKNGRREQQQAAETVEPLKLSE
jgi:hypothetical protein